MDTFLEWLRNLVSGVLEAPWADFLYSVRVVFGFLDVVLIVFLVWVFLHARELRPPFTHRHRLTPRVPTLDQKVFMERWARIIKKAAASPPQSHVLAIIEADKCVDDALKTMGLQGEHMADRLEKLRVEDHPTLDRLWRAHRVRNELVHTPDFGIDEGDAKDVLKVYEKFLKELGALPV